MGLGGAWENDISLQGAGGALAIIFRELGIELLILGRWEAVSECFLFNLTHYWPF